ncbi:MAG: sigma-70 family RNA polymerase sigma factor [Xanthomonadales bacterium]|nr:sigma-70 family RNA polymerase sigma factor [Xanthomonadales bacterium]
MTFSTAKARTSTTAAPGVQANAMSQPLESTATLLAHVRAGDEGARERLCATYLPMLRRWASGRLPAQARDLAETDDMVQITLMRALNRIDEFQPRHEGAFLAYLRQIMLNNIRAEIRRVASLPPRSELVQEPPANAPELADQMAQLQLMEQYEAALEQLGESQREAVMLRVEFGFSYAEIAQALNIPSANAARMCVCRALEKLAALM